MGNIRIQSQQPSGNGHDDRDSKKLGGYALIGAIGVAAVIALSHLTRTATQGVHSIIEDIFGPIDHVTEEIADLIDQAIHSGDDQSVIDPGAYAAAIQAEIASTQPLTFASQAVQQTVLDLQLLSGIAQAAQSVGNCRTIALAAVRCVLWPEVYSGRASDWEAPSDLVTFTQSFQINSKIVMKRFGGFAGSYKKGRLWVICTRVTQGADPIYKAVVLFTRNQPEARSNFRPYIGASSHNFYDCDPRYWAFKINGEWTTFQDLGYEWPSSVTKPNGLFQGPYAYQFHWSDIVRPFTAALDQNEYNNQCFFLQRSLLATASEVNAWLRSERVRAWFFDGMPRALLAGQTYSGYLAEPAHLAALSSGLVSLSEAAGTTEDATSEEMWRINNLTLQSSLELISQQPLTQIDYHAVNIPYMIAVLANSAEDVYPWQRESVFGAVSFLTEQRKSLFVRAGLASLYYKFCSIELTSDIIQLSNQLAAASSHLSVADYLIVFGSLNRDRLTPLEGLALADLEVFASTHPTQSIRVEWQSIFSGLFLQGFWYDGRDKGLERILSYETFTSSSGNFFPIPFRSAGIPAVDFTSRASWRTDTLQLGDIWFARSGNEAFRSEVTYSLPDMTDTERNYWALFMDALSQ